ncbi:MAG TPA: NADP-dependent malic enzyme, partial [Nitrososphaera sp.]|nr:NADP-dependent malic enzyme [Nitrososphaera sp.]
MTVKEDAINLHRMLRGKIEIQNRVSLDNVFEDEKGTLGLIYTPGVAYVSTEISNNKDLVYDYTSKWNNVAIVCDGTRVLGLGNVGPEAALPVMEGKSVLFKSLGGINAIPLCISIQDKEEIIRFVKAIQPVFGAVNIEDIESPKVLEIVERLKSELNIPVFHDDQHGTAIIALAALINALRLIGKRLDSARVVIAGAGSAGYGIFKILYQAGCRDIIVADSKGAIYNERSDLIDENNRRNNPYRLEIATKTNPSQLSGSLADIIKGSDVFIGVSGKGGIVSKVALDSMNHNAIVFALSNPDPEILPSEAVQAGARIIATGRSDFPNQVNNAVVFPSLLRSLLDLRARNINEDMLVAVAYAIANLVDSKHLADDFIVPRVN